MIHGGKFQSAPSLRKVTTSHGIYGNGRLISIHTFPAKGDKRLSLITIYLIISIHTFFAEGDDLMILGVLFFIISIHTFLAEGDANEAEVLDSTDISIHTFLTEGDVKLSSYDELFGAFQSTPSLRKVTLLPKSSAP